MNGRFFLLLPSILRARKHIRETCGCSIISVEVEERHSLQKQLQSEIVFKSLKGVVLTSSLPPPHLSAPPLLLLLLFLPFPMNLSSCLIPMSSCLHPSRPLTPFIGNLAHSVSKRWAQIHQYCLVLTPKPSPQSRKQFCLSHDRLHSALLLPRITLACLAAVCWVFTQTSCLPLSCQHIPCISCPGQRPLSPFHDPIRQCCHCSLRTKALLC